jgi:probable addiction module antidote protein
MKTPKGFSKFDAAEYLRTKEDMAAYLEACIEEAGDDAVLISEALGIIARAQGMTKIAKETGMTRKGLYKALSSDGNPEFSTILKVLKALGIKLHASA